MTQYFSLVFPGQGSQKLGMLAELAKEFSCVKEIFAEASDVLNYDLWQITQDGPEIKLNETEITQPAMLAADIAVYRCWQAKSAGRPFIMAGHSLGEYAALVAANSINFTDAIALVAKRGKYMQQSPAGSMAAIVGLDEIKIRELCELAAREEILAPANFNSIGQTVIAGNQAAVERSLEIAKSLGAKIAKIIPVSVASHSPLMQSAADKLAKDLQQISIRPPEISVLQNADVQSHTEPDKIRDALIQQLTSPVRWVETIQNMVQEKVRTCIECGPGKVLMGLIKRIDPQLNILLTETPTLLIETCEKIKSTGEK